MKTILQSFAATAAARVCGPLVLWLGGQTASRESVRGKRAKRGCSFVLLISLAVVVGCAGNLYVRPPSAPASAGRGRFVAGAGRADLTPPPGLPMFGFSVAAKIGRGYRTRLYARAMYLESAAGDRLALVQCDLGAVSALLHRRVAAAVIGTTGISADRLLIAATHTHSAPGGYFGSAVYNLWGSARPGFDEHLLDFLVERISQAIVQAHRSAAPAKIAIGEIAIAGVTRNRSFVAYHANSTPGLATTAEGAVDNVLTMVRLDHSDGETNRPLGALSIFAIHGTAVPPAVDLYNGDVHAAAERILEAKIKKNYTVDDDVIHALANGAEGDVAPNFVVQGFSNAYYLGRTIADSAFALFTSLDSALQDKVVLRRSFAEIDLRRGHEVDGHPLCRQALFGAPVLAGSEEGAPSNPLAHEGDRLAMPSGCQTWKKPALGELQRFHPGSDFPTKMTLQLFQIGHLLLAAIPGEMTTEMGRRLREACLASARDAQLGVQKVAIVGLANQYMSYFTTPEEYATQQYEGGANLYGENTGPFVSQQLALLVKDMGGDEVPVVRNRWTFAPGWRRSFTPKKRSLVVARRAGALAQNAGTASFTWSDLPPGTLDIGEQLVRIEAQDNAGNWQPLVTAGGSVDDRGLDIEVRFLGADSDGRGWRWRATWLPAEPLPEGVFRFVIVGGPGQGALYSPPFVL